MDVIISKCRYCGINIYSDDESWDSWDIGSRGVICDGCHEEIREEQENEII